MEKNFKWYVLSVRSNKEMAVKERIEKETEHFACSDLVECVYVPTAEQVNNRTKKIVRKPLLKGTVFVYCDLTPQLDSILRGVSDVFGFVGGKAVAVPQEQIIGMISATDCSRFDGCGEAVVNVCSRLKVGDEVIVNDGPFKSLKGTVTSVERGDRVVVEVMVFRRAFSLELSTTQVEPSRSNAVA